MPVPPGAAGDQASDGAVDAAVLRSAVALQHEIAAADLGTAMRRVAERTRALTGASAAHVTMLDGDELVTGATDGPADLRLPDRFRTDASLTWHAISSGRPVLCVDTETDERADAALARAIGIRSFVVVPLLHGGATIGLLIVSGREPGTFDGGDVVNLELLSIVLSTAIAHAAERDAQREQRRRGELLERIVATQRDIAAAGVDLQGVMALIVERSMALTGADGGMVSLIEGEELVVGAAAGRASGLVGNRRTIDGSIVQHAIAARDTLLIERTEDDPRINREMQKAVGDLSHICVPLFAGERPVAALSTMSSSETERFDEEDRRTLELLAVALAAAVSRAAEFEAKREQVGALARFEATFAGSLTGMIMADLDGRILDANPAIQELLGQALEDMLGRRVSEFVHPDDRDVVRARFLGADEAASSLRLDHRFVRRDGDVRWVDSSISFVRDAEGHRSFAVSTIQDVTQRKAAEAALLAQAELNEHQALHDALTGLANRTLFHDRIDHAVRSARRTDGTAAVLLMDLDRFKEINDALGHAAGDELLVELAGRLEHALRASDTVARLGGDEFGVLLPDPAVLEDVLRVIDRMQAAIAEPVTVQGLPLSLEASIGVALFPEDGDDVETLIQHADVAMYQAKAENAGYAFYDAASCETHDPGRLTLVGELRRALEQRELTLYYQPKAVLHDGGVHSVEALLRWNHPERGLVGPDDFIPLAQQTGLIKPLTLYVIDEALRQCRAWLEDGERLAIAVNLSTRNLLDVQFPTEVQGLLDRWSIEPDLLELEITESTMLADPVRTKQILERLSSMGIRLSIDDFGTGYSSLAYLRGLPVDEIKIDRSFVIGMDRSEDDATIVRSTIDLGRNLGLEVVAEGVETEAVWNRLSSLGCTVAQGYYLSRPVPPAELRAWLAARRGAPVT